jgi:hypothetical protein
MVSNIVHDSYKVIGQLSRWRQYQRLASRNLRVYELKYSNDASKGLARALSLFDDSVMSLNDGIEAFAL